MWVTARTEEHQGGELSPPCLRGERPGPRRWPCLWLQVTVSPGSLGAGPGQNSPGPDVEQAVNV